MNSRKSHESSPPAFQCVKGCSDCCIEREYFPTEQFGRIGVLLLPNEKTAIEAEAERLGMTVRIIPRLAVIPGRAGSGEPEILAFQMMGERGDGRLCPFLDTASAERSPHGGYKCRIYKDRPLACRAYPLLSIGQKGTIETAELDEHCAFCKQSGTSRANLAGLERERESLAIIQSTVTAKENDTILRYATATGDEGVSMLPEGWVVE
ncbi:MAG: YkgJ family cysteine cluster protein [Nitrososphaera sp.]